MDGEVSAVIAMTSAVEQGRVIFSNIRKFVAHLVSYNVSEILIIALASFVGTPLPILPLKILFLKLVTDIFPALALGVGEESPDVMNRPPRSLKEQLLARNHWCRTSGYAAAITVSVLASLVVALLILDFSERDAATIFFLTLAFAQLFHVFNMCDASAGLLKNDITRNPYVWLALVLCVALLASSVYLLVLSAVLRLEPSGALGWSVVALFNLLPLLVGEVARRVAPAGETLITTGERKEL